MYNPQTSLRHILSPTTPEAFFADYLGRKPLYIPGAADKFAGLFGWSDLDRMLELNHVWNDVRLNLMRDNMRVDPVEYSELFTHEGRTARKPSMSRIGDYMEQGASLVLNAIESYSSGSLSVANSLTAALGSKFDCNLYCSFKEYQAFSPHFDFMDVFVIHFEGEKDWEIYTGNFELAAGAEGFRFGDFSAEYHVEARGEIEQELRLSPGDVLYLPRGKYHSARSSSDACLHLTFGLAARQGFHFMNKIVESLTDDPFFRTDLPHYDQPDVARAYLQEAAKHISHILNQPVVAEQMRDFARHEALMDVREYGLPTGRTRRLYRVRGAGVNVADGPNGKRIVAASGGKDITDVQARIIEWLLKVDIFAEDDAVEAFADIAEAERRSVFDYLEGIGLIIPV